MYIFSIKLFYKFTIFKTIKQKIYFYLSLYNNKNEKTATYCNKRTFT